MMHGPESSLGMFQIALRSSNYVNTPHLDVNDAVSRGVTSATFSKWETSLAQDVLCRQEEERLNEVSLFAKEYSLAVFTAVSYQFVKTMAGEAETDHQTKVHQLWLFSSIGVTKRIQNFETHVWMARVLPHATCVPVFVKNELVSFGRHADVTVESWGSAKSNS